MNTITDSYGITYQIVNGTAYHADTPPQVIDILEKCLHSRRQYRFRIWDGDRNTGRAWGDIETGYIERSTGPIKIPILISNTRSLGGPGLLDHCIVKIEYANKKDGGILYQHKDFYEVWG